MESEAIKLLLQTLLEETRAQRTTSAALSEAMNHNALEVERLSNRVAQLHSDLGLLVALTNRVTVIERERAEERTRGKVYAGIGAAAAATIGAIGAIVGPWLLERL